MLVLSHPGFTSVSRLLKAQKAKMAIQMALWGEQGSNLSELNMIGDVVPYVYNVPEFEIDCSRLLRAVGGIIGSPVKIQRKGLIV